MERVVIIEDEELAAEKLSLLIKRSHPELEIAAKLTSVKQSIQWLSENTVDLIFMDINLSDDLCFKIFEKIEIESPIIFTTAYDEYAIKAFKQNSLDYLLKPIAEDELKASVLKFEKYRSRGDQQDNRIHQLIAQYLPTTQFKQRILVSYGGKSKSIPVEEVAYVYAMNKGVFITTHEGSNFLTDDTLDVLEGQLDPAQFYRVNRKFLLSVHAIREIEKFSTRRLKVNAVPPSRDGIIVPADKITEFKKWLNQ